MFKPQTGSVKLIAWVKFHRAAYLDVKKNYLEILLPKMVSARYVTACMLECENYL